MDALVIVGAIAAIVGIVAGIVQVLDYLQKRRESRHESQSETEARPVVPASPDPYNIAAIRNLLRDAFTAGEFRRFCRDRPLFEPLLSRFGPGASLEDTIEIAIEYCQKRSLLPDLLAEVKAFNPRQWERYYGLIHQHEELIEPRIPQNLDPRSEFVGRKAEKAEVHEALRRSRLVCIEGIGGIGKTALALEVAHECLQASQDSSQALDVATFAGFVWASAKDRDLDLDDLLNTMARTLDYVGIAQKPHGEKRVAVCDLLRAKSYLLIVDNYETITDEDVRDFLIKLPEPSKALVTSRERKWTEAEAIPLSDLSPAESLRLMRRVSHRLKLGAIEQVRDQDLWPLHQVTHGVPLTIKWAIGQIKQKGQSLDRIVGTLTGDRSEIFDAMFARSWSLLTSNAQQVLTMMPLFATSASWEAIEAVSDVKHFALDDALGKLVEMSLVDAMDEPNLSRRRYSIHPLTRAFAVRESKRKPDSVRGAWERILVYYKELVAPPEEKRIGIPYWDGLANHTRCRGMETEWNNLSHLADLALENDRGIDALELFLPVVHCLHSWGLWDLRLRLSLNLCRIITEPTVVWLWIDAIGHILIARNQFKESMQALDKGMSLARQWLDKDESLARQDGLGDASILVDVFKASIYRSEGNIELAQECLENALVRLDSIRASEPIHRIIERRAVTMAARMSTQLKDRKRLVEREMELRRLTGEDMTPALSSLADVSLSLGDVLAAEEYLEQASASARTKHIMPFLNLRRAEIAEVRGDLQEAQRQCLVALDRFTRLGLERQIHQCEVFLARLPGSANCEERNP